MGIRTEGVRWLVMDVTGEPNKYPVKCDWCGVDLISYAASKVQMNETDTSDYNWACVECYKKAWE